MGIDVFIITEGGNLVYLLLYGEETKLGVYVFVLRGNTKLGVHVCIYVVEWKHEASYIYHWWEHEACFISTLSQSFFDDQEKICRTPQFVS